MQSIRSLFLLLGITLLTFSCSEDKPTTATLIANLSQLGLETLEVYNIEKELLYDISPGMDTITLDISEDVILNLTIARSNSYVHVRPGETITLTIVPGESFQIGSKEDTPENKYLLSFAQQAEVQAKAKPFHELAKSEVADFLEQLNQKHQPLAALMDQINGDKSVSAYFKEAMQNRLLASKANDLLGYKDMYNYWNKSYPVLPQDYYAEAEKIDPTATNLLLFEEGRSFGNTWHAKDVSYQDYPSVGAYFNAMGETAAAAYPNSLMGDFCQYEMLSSQVNFGGGIDEAGPALEKFQNTVTNSYLLGKLEKTVAPWLNLRSGLAAPNFVGSTRKGEAVQLTELKGKKVYIDVWATWCGPCIREIPALKSLEKEMHNENIEFVSISIDEARNKDKWLNFLTEKDLGGLQLLADGAWASDIATEYNIKGIPRFLLIDEEGKIISANAPRPSDPSIKEVLMN